MSQQLPKFHTLFVSYQSHALLENASPLRNWTSSTPQTAWPREWLSNCIPSVNTLFAQVTTWELFQNYLLFLEWSTIIGTFAISPSLEKLKIKMYKITTLPLLLYNFETWTVTLKECCRQGVFEKRMLKWIFGPKKYQNWKWTRLHNDELHSLYHSPKIARAVT